MYNLYLFQIEKRLTWQVYALLCLETNNDNRSLFSYSNHAGMKNIDLFWVHVK